jgi:glycosyltransferase involved in cell wall biosynthesis
MKLEMLSPTRVALLIPCYNEEAAIAKVVADFKTALPGAAVYVYDNNSRDRTAEVARAALAALEQREVVGLDVEGDEPLERADAERQAVVAAVYAPDAAARQGPELDRVYTDADFLGRVGLTPDGSAPAGMTFVSRVIPVGTKLVEFADTRATVEVWYTSLFGMAGEGSTNPVTEAWYTNIIELTWLDGDWKVVEFEQVEGPVPVGRDQRASTAEEMAEASEQFGGFTYAR